MQTFVLFSSANLRMILVSLSIFSSSTSMESLRSSEFELSTMSLEVDPKWTYSPASPSHTSLNPFESDAMSCLVSASISLTRSTVTYFTKAFFAISSAYSFGMIPSSPSACASADSTSSILCCLFSCSQILFISGVPYLNSIGCIAI